MMAVNIAKMVKLKERHPDETTTSSNRQDLVGQGLPSCHLYKAPDTTSTFSRRRRPHGHRAAKV